MFNMLIRVSVNSLFFNLQKVNTNYVVAKMWQTFEVLNGQFIWLVTLVKLNKIGFCVFANKDIIWHLKAWILSIISEIKRARILDISARIFKMSNGSRRPKPFVCAVEIDQNF